MSTDIIRWNSDADGRLKKIVSTGALQLYLTITLPLMIGTFAAWYGVYWWVNTKDHSLIGFRRRSLSRMKGGSRAGMA
jgi:hypothetical protein